MKNTFAALLILATTATSFGMHAYRDESCVSSTHKLVYSGEPVGSAYTLTNLKTNGTTDVYTKEDAAEAPGSGSFEIVASKILSSKMKKDSCKKNSDGFDEESYKSQMVVNFSKLTQDDEKKSGISSGTYMIFNCSSTESYPANCK